MAKQVSINFNDHTVTIISDNSTYVDTFDNFTTDAGRVVPPYPEEWHYLQFAPGDTRLIVFLDDGSQVERKNPEYRQFVGWCMGAVTSIIEAKSRRAPKPNDPPPDSMAQSINHLQQQVTAMQQTIAELNQRINNLGLQQ